ncbi:MAG: cation-translocating P-type ATPase [Deltaproteobacteria bacterium]|nr:cation-translocating P-type ATPase [Deltaproteobacteria bacterium]
MEFHASTSEEVLKHFSSGIGGLDEEVAKKRLSQYGPNEITRKREISPLRIFLSQFNSFIVYILIAAVIISVILHEYIDSAVIIAILIVNAVLGFFQEYRAERAIESLKQMAALQATVIRNGEKKRVNSNELVPGDMIGFESGDRIPADARIVEGYLLEVMESSLTGESHSVKKEPASISSTSTLGDMKNILFAGTSVTSGSGQAVVVRTGMDTEMGKIAESIDSVEDDETPLQKRLDKLGRKLGLLTLIICGIIIVFGIFKGGNILEMIMVGVSLAVAAVPEGLPIVVTIALALGVKRMVRHNALIKRLHSVETLGCTTVICTDKTGTLTRNEMTVTKLYVNDMIVDVTGTGYGSSGEFLSSEKKIDPLSAELLLRIGLLNNDAALTEKENIIGDPTEGCLIVSAAKAGLKKSILNDHFPRVNEIPFDSERKRKSTVHRTKEGIMMYTKGAPDMVINLCSRINISGKISPLTDEIRQNIIEVNQNFASQALRVLAFAYKPIDSAEGVEKSDEQDLIFVGLQGMIDPPRNQVKSAIDKCKHAGIRSVMITGDYALTAQAIAHQLGIEGDAVTGEELEKLNDETLKRTVKEISIFSRVNPKHKIQIVRALRETGEVVAMSGDGINDAPALKEADIGIAMGITGTDVTKETADMVLLDDKYTSIVNAVEQGRGIYENIKKFVNYLLSSNLGEVLILFIAMIIGLKDSSGAIVMPLLATQILWLNLITDGLPAVALGVDPIRRGIMDAPPRNPQEPIITKEMAINIIAISILMAAGVLFLFYRFLPEGNTIARTIAFTSIVLLEMVRVAMIRSQYKLPFFSNLYLIGAIILSVLLQVAVVYLPAMNIVFKTTALSIHHWSYMVAVMAVIFVIGVFMTRLMNRKPKVSYDPV